MYLLGKQVKHSVATDEAEECTRDVLALIEAREVPADSTMPLLIHDVCTALHITQPRTLAQMPAYSVKLQLSEFTG